MKGRGYTVPPWLKGRTKVTPKWVQEMDNRNEKLEQNRLDNKEGRDIYQTRRWKFERKQYMKSHPICEKCRKIGTASEAKVLDHIIPMRQNGAIWDRRNFMALCTECHNIKRGKEKAGKIHKGKNNGQGELIPVDRWQVV